MTSTDKVIVGATAVIAISAIAMLTISDKYETATNEVLEELHDIHYILSRSREDIVIGNREIVEGNKMLRDLIKRGADEMVEEET